MTGDGHSVVMLVIYQSSAVAEGLSTANSSNDAMAAIVSLDVIDFEVSSFIVVVLLLEYVIFSSWYSFSHHQSFSKWREMNCHLEFLLDQY